MEVSAQRRVSRTTLCTGVAWSLLGPHNLLESAACVGGKRVIMVRARELISPTIQVVSAGIGAAVGGPLGAAFGGCIGGALGASTAKLVETSSEKAVEKFFETTGNSLAEKLKAPSPRLEAVYREALRRSLKQIRPQIGGDVGTWFDNWERGLAASTSLDLPPVGPHRIFRENPNALLRRTMEHLDRHGAATLQPSPSITAGFRSMPDALYSELEHRLPGQFEANFRRVVTEPDYKDAWNEAILAFQDSFAETLERIGQQTKRIDQRTERIDRRTESMQAQLAELPAVVKAQLAELIGPVIKDAGLREAVEQSGASKEKDDQIPWNPTWVPQRFALDVRIGGEASIDELKPITPVLVRFARSPSRRWRDPKIGSIALRDQDDKTASARPISPLLWRNLSGRNRGSIIPLQQEWAGWPLCIPSYEIPVEWRLESYVYSPPWREVKDHIVREFLKACEHKHIECRVISLNQERGKWKLLVHSDDYDEFLRMHWPYYKALEGVLTRGEYYRVASGLHSSPRPIAEAIVSSARFQDWLTQTHGERFQQRPIHWPDVSLMLAGIIEREGESIRRVESQGSRT